MERKKYAPLSDDKRRFGRAIVAMGNDPLARSVVHKMPPAVRKEILRFLEAKGLPFHRFTIAVALCISFEIDLLQLSSKSVLPELLRGLKSEFDAISKGGIDAPESILPMLTRVLEAASGEWAESVATSNE